MSTGLAIVIDTTISMKPYIDETLKMVRTVYDKLSKSGVADNVGIAVVAFRSNTSKSPGIEYTTKVISDFKRINDRKELERLLAQVEEAKAATHAFDEDSIAGVMEAADSLSWDQFSARAMLLITDAGPLGAGDSTAKTGMSPEAMADYLRTNNIFLTTFHVRTPAGKKDHSYAEKSYRALSLLSNGQSSYIPLQAKTTKEAASSFARASETLASTYLEIVENESRNELVKPEMIDPPKQSTPEEKARYIAEITGYAMRLQFAGNRKGTEAPSVVSAWISDSDLAGIEKNPDSAPVPAVYPAVLLTKSQLSQLRKQLKTIIQSAEEAFFRDNENFNFYEQLISAAAQMSRDPSQFNQSPEANLAQRGVLLEVLDGLPYKSRILGMRQDDWTNMSTGEQQDFIRRLKGLVRRYEEYDRDNEHWEGFGESNPNEWVYRVPLNVLP